MTTDTKLKIVLDTNIFISVFVFRGMMMQAVLDLVASQKIQMYFSPALKAELLRKLGYFRVDKSFQNEIIRFIETRGNLTEPQIKINTSRDPKDNFILELAEEAKADYIITRDKDLLELPGKKWKKTKIKKPEDFLPLLRKMNLLKP